MSGWTRTDALEVMDGKFRFHYRSADGGGRLADAGECNTLLEAQAEQARWEAFKPGWQVWIVQYGRFVEVDEERGEAVRR